MKISCPKCNHEFEKEINGYVGRTFFVDGVEMRIFSCYGETLEKLSKHIECCRKHYPEAIFEPIVPPRPPTITNFTVRMLVPKWSYKCSCPPDNEKGCNS